MTEFNTDVALDFEIESGALSDVRSEIESELDSMPITAADAGGGVMADGGSPLSGLGEGIDSLVSLAEDRNTILAELREALDAQAVESAQGGGGGGGGLLRGFGAARLLGGGGGIAAGGLASFFGGLGKALPGIGGGTGIGTPAIGPEFAKRVEGLRDALGEDSLIPEGLTDGAGGGTQMALTGPLTGGSVGLGDLFSSVDWPDPPDPFAGVDWPDIPDLPDFSWPKPPSLPEFNWPEVPGLPELSWPEPPDPFRGLSTRDWPSVPNPFADLAPRDWPSPPNPFAGFDWPEPPDPFAGFDWPDPPDLSLDLSIDIGNLGRTIEKRIKQILRDEVGLDVR